jgi:hypothetical protein
MHISEMARALGSRGGLSRARRLSSRRRADIARAGASAREESLRLARAIRTNFDYVDAIRELHPPGAVRSEARGRGRLPGIYGPEAKG